MLKKILTTIVAISALGAISAYAATPGIYVTGQIGYANNNMHIETDKIFAINDLSESNLAGRLAVGYQFNQNFAVEAGYYRMSQEKTTIAYFDRYEPKINTGKLTYDQNAIDLVAKGILPVSNNLNLYGKLGVAYLTTQGDATSGPDDFNLATISKRKLAPEAAIGVTYNVTANVSVDASWTHIHPVGNDRPGNVNFVAVGLGYNFG